MSKRPTDETEPTSRAESALINWRDFDPSWLPGGEQAPLATELVTYRDNLDKLLEHEGQYAVIRGRSVLGFYRDRQSALAAAFKEYGAVSVLIKQVVEMEPVRQLGNVAR